MIEVGLPSVQISPPQPHPWASEIFIYIMRYIISMTTSIEAHARKWGDSLAVILPRDVVNQEGIRVNDRIHITLQKEVDISDLFGAWKTKKTPQELKDESRKEWE